MIGRMMNENLQREHVSEGVVEEVVSRRDAVIAQGDGTELPGNPNSVIHHFIKIKMSISDCLRRRLELNRIERIVINDFIRINQWLIIRLRRRLELNRFERIVRDTDTRRADRVSPHLEHPPADELMN